MSDFPEKENLEGQEAEFSTIFSDPVKHSDQKAKSNKLLPKIIAGVVALALLAGGTVAVIRFIPVKEDGGAVSSGEDEAISLKKLDTDDITSVKVTNAIGVTELYSETTKETTTNSSSTETVTWHTKQVDAQLTDSTKIEAVVTAVADISSRLEITQKTSEECGLSKPSLKAEVTPKEGSAYTVLIGAQSPDKTGYYLQIEGDEKIYLVNDSVYTALQFELLDFADTSTVLGVVNENNEFDAYYDEGELARFDRFEVSGKNFEERVVILPNTNKEISQYYNYLVVSPQKRLAENFENFLTVYKNGISVSGAYSYDVSAASLKKFGLDNPDIYTQMQFKNKVFSFKLAKQEDGNYALIGTDSKLIYMVEADYISEITQYKSEDLYSAAIFMTHIDDISNFTVKTADKEYSFDISKNEANEDGEEPEEKYNVVINGETLKSQNFQNYYGHCIGFDVIDFKTEEISNAPKLSFIVTNNDSSRTVVEFAKLSATRYQASVDGVAMGKITATDVNKLISLTEDVAGGKTITD